MAGLTPAAASEASDDWGPALPLKTATPSRTDGSSTLPATSSTSTLPSSSPEPRQRFDSDPVYQADLQKAKGGFRLLTTALTAAQFSQRPSGASGGIPPGTMGYASSSATTAKTASVLGAFAPRRSESGTPANGAKDVHPRKSPPIKTHQPPPPPPPSRTTAAPRPAPAPVTPGKQAKRQSATAHGQQQGSTSRAAEITQSLGDLAISAASAAAAAMPKSNHRTGGGHLPMRSGPGSHARAPPQARFEEHLPEELLQRLVKSGAALTGRLRVNSTDRTEAYISVPGLPFDVMIRGEQHQNRAVDGDEVVVEVLPMPLWFKAFRHMPAELIDRFTALKDQCHWRTDNPAANFKFGIQSGAHLDPLLLMPWAQSGSPEKAKEALCTALLIAPPNSLRTTGKVVAITGMGPRREQVVGVLQTGVGKGPDGKPPLWLLPLDATLPRCRVHSSKAAALSSALLQEATGPLEGPEAHRTLVAARITEWSAHSEYPEVDIKQSLGQAGEIESETDAILYINKVQDVDFPEKVLACLPPTPWSMAPADMEGRRDFRGHRIFSIDPATARDLDDALHISPVKGVPGHWHVGVHIADVGHFIVPYSALDFAAGMRATSVYMVQRVVPMLPRLLCEELCSLNPGVDRLAFSIEWELNEKGEVVSEWAGRSIIRSRAKLAYPMVQAMIEKSFQPEECQAALHDGATWDEVIRDCLGLWELARQRRTQRFDEGGALRLDGIKLSFGLDVDGNPSSFSQYRTGEANQLVEEFMLLANMRVAKLIAGSLPERALLRNHPPPNEKKMAELAVISDAHDLHLDCSNAAGLQSTLQRFRDTHEDRMAVETVVQLATRPMQLATYFCTGLQPDRDTWAHYALAVPEYTHFTSPIRRYPDLVVHRLLAAVLEAKPSLTFASPDYYEPSSTALVPRSRPTALVQTLEKVAENHKLFKADLTGRVATHCNEQRLAARNAQEASLTLYLCVLLRRQPLVTTGIVCNLGGDKFVGLYLPQLGIEIKLMLEDQGAPLTGTFHQQAGTLVITHEEKEKQTKRGRQEEPPHEVVPYGTWLAALEGLKVPSGLTPVQLPLQLRMFTAVPVALTSPLRLGQVSKVVGRLFLDPSQLADTQDSQEAEPDLAAASTLVEAALQRATQSPVPETVAANVIVAGDMILDD